MISKSKKTYRDYLQSPAWHARRTQVIFRDEGQCQAIRGGVKCGSRHKTQVHHKTYLRFGQEPLTDLVLLCKKCHEQLHKQQKVINNGKEKNRRRTG